MMYHERFMVDWRCHESMVECAEEIASYLAFGSWQSTALEPLYPNLCKMTSISDGGLHFEMIQYGTHGGSDESFGEFLLPWDELKPYWCGIGAYRLPNADDALALGARRDLLVKAWQDRRREKIEEAQRQRQVVERSERERQFLELSKEFGQPKFGHQE